MSLKENKATEKQNICTEASIEAQREARYLKHWLVKVVVVSLLLVFIASSFSFIYTVVVLEKDVGASFIGEMFTNLFKLLHILLV